MMRKGHYPQNRTVRNVQPIEWFWVLTIGTNHYPNPAERRRAMIEAFVITVYITSIFAAAYAISYLLWSIAIRKRRARRKV